MTTAFDFMNHVMDGQDDLSYLLQEDPMPSFDAVVSAAISTASALGSMNSNDNLHRVNSPTSSDISHCVSTSSLGANGSKEEEYIEESDAFASILSSSGSPMSIMSDDLDSSSLESSSPLLDTMSSTTSSPLSLFQFGQQQLPQSVIFASKLLQQQHDPLLETFFKGFADAKQQEHLKQIKLEEEQQYMARAAFQQQQQQQQQQQSIQKQNSPQSTAKPSESAEIDISDGYPEDSRSTSPSPSSTSSSSLSSSSSKKKRSLANSKQHSAVLRELAEKATRLAAVSHSQKKRDRGGMDAASMEDDDDDIDDSNLSADDKEKKRQRRLIKNRESAQASRERKKVYMQNLEQRVTELTEKNNTLTSEVEVLHKENEFLREKLRRLENGEYVVGMDHDRCTKKRRTTKSTESSSPKLTAMAHTSTPIAVETVAITAAESPSISTSPASQSAVQQQQQQSSSSLPSFLNPFDPTFWSFMMGFHQQLQQQQQTQQQESTQQQQHISAAAAASKRVFMLIVLFCVAFMVVYPNAERLSSTVPAALERGNSPVSLASSGSSDSATSTTAGSSVPVERAGARTILQTYEDNKLIKVTFLPKDTSLSTQSQQLLQEQFNKNLMCLNSNMIQNFASAMTGVPVLSVATPTAEEDDGIAFDFEFDKKRNELMISLKQDEDQLKKKRGPGRPRKHPLPGQAKNGSTFTLSSAMFKSICGMINHQQQPQPQVQLQ